LTFNFKSGMHQRRERVDRRRASKYSNALSRVTTQKKKFSMAKFAPRNSQDAKVDRNCTPLGERTKNTSRDYARKQGKGHWWEKQKRGDSWRRERDKEKGKSGRNFNKRERRVQFGATDL